MTLSYHPAVYDDLDVIMRYYEEVAGARLADGFYSEFRRFVELAATNPHMFNPRRNGLHRVNLERFPYHFWFRLNGGSLRVLVVRHHARKPGLGLGRK
jgi:plasmid stabilization system protein ParE